MPIILVAKGILLASYRVIPETNNTRSVSTVLEPIKSEKAAEITPERSLRERIFEAARSRFLEYGYSKISMEEIARDLGISKKTLYTEYESKEDLLRDVVRHLLKDFSDDLENALREPSLRFVDKLRILMSKMGQHKLRMSPAFARDIETYAPSVWDDIREYRRKRSGRFLELVKAGVESGELRSDVNPVLVSRLYQNVVETMLHHSSLDELGMTAPQVYEAIIGVIFEGTLTPESREQFRKT